MFVGPGTHRKDNRPSEPPCAACVPGEWLHLEVHEVVSVGWCLKEDTEIYDPVEIHKRNYLRFHSTWSGPTTAIVSFSGTS